MKAILSQAVDWHLRLNDSTANRDTQAGWQAWLAADARHVEAWQRLERLQQRLGQAPLGAADALEGARRSRRNAIKALVLFMGVGALGWQGWQASPWSADLATRIGERRRLTLADGSLLDLDTNTRVDVRFNAGERLLRLHQGEILLDAVRGPQPFTVETAEGRITTLGARTAVRQGEGWSRVSVESAAVQVQPRLAEHAVQVPTGQMLRFDARTPGVLQPAPDDASAWTRGMLVAVGWRLDALLDELARYRHGYLGCADDVAGLRLSGAFSLEDIDAVLANLEASLPVRIRRVTRYWTRIEQRPA